MKITSIVIIFLVLLTTAITVHDAGEKPVSSAIILAVDCCPPPCPPICPPGQTY
jgi:hypothetical protein